MSIRAIAYRASIFALTAGGLALSGGGAAQAQSEASQAIATAPAGSAAPALVSTAAAAAAADSASSGGASNTTEVQGLTVIGRREVVGTLHTAKDVFTTPETVRVLDAAQMQTLGPVAGGAQSFGLNPGAYVNGYGATGATKYTISLDGIGQGWGGYGGYTGGASLMVTMDGVPIVDPSTGLWSSAAFPSLSMFQTQQVTYGPGDAASRYYDNIGGNIELTPLQPTHNAGGIISDTFGSYGEEMVNFSLQTGEHHGWSAVLAGSYGQSDSFRSSPDGFDSPSTDYVLYAKILKTFDRGSIAFGGYYARGAGYRSQVIPVSANPYITMNGDTSGQTAVVPGKLYSQQTSGFYSALPYSNYEKYDVNEIGVGYAKLNYNIDSTTTLNDVAYYATEDRYHIRHNDVFLLGDNNLQEYNWPNHWWFGDKLSLTKTWGINTFDVGAWAQDAEYTTQQSFFNPASPYNGSLFDPSGKYRYGSWNEIDTAFYVQDGVHLLPNLLVQGGLRQANFWVSYSDGAQQEVPSAYQAYPQHDQGSLGNGLPAYQHRNFSGLEPSVEVDYRPLHWLRLYGSYEESYKTPQVGGGGGLYQAIDGAYAQLAHAKEFQAGFKVLTDQPQYGLGGFDFGANYFHLDYDKQTITTALANGDGATSFGNSYYEGVNAFADDTPWRKLHVFANASYVNAIYSYYYTGPIAPVTPASTSPNLYYNGSHVPYVPKVNFNLGADYKFNFNGVIFDPYLLYQYTGEQYIFNNVTVAPSNQTLSGYGTLNLGFHSDIPVTVAGRARSITVSLGVQNVTDNRYNSYEWISSGGYFNTAAIAPAGSPYGSGYTLAYPGAPTTVYATIGVAF